MRRDLVTKREPQSVESFAGDLREKVEELASILATVFEAYVRGEVGEGVGRSTSSLFDEWAQKSYIIPPQRIRQRLGELVTTPSDELREDVRQVLVKEFFISPVIADRAADKLVSGLRAGAEKEEAIEETLWASYEEPRRRFLVQSAHVFVARVLLRRIGEDRNSHPPWLSGEALRRRLDNSKADFAGIDTPALDMTSQVRAKMAELFPAIYDLSEFDWWWISDEKRATLDDPEKSRLVSIEKEMELFTRRLLRGFDQYELSEMDVDVWRSVYANYLPEEERQRLGGFYTPPELVEFILDLAGYVPQRRGLCQEPFLDLASGSGAFVVEALNRLLLHLDEEYPCHQDVNVRQAPWERAQVILKYVDANLHALDLHPFAAFLTTANVIFPLVQHLKDARHKYPQLTLDLSIFCTDSLMKGAALLIEDFERLNARGQLAARSFKRYQQMQAKKFSFVFGNPPWGGVLKGPLSPIFDEDKKRHFKEGFPEVAVGKYDIYGLFLARGLELLGENGTLAMITQNTYVEKDWAEGLRRHLATSTKIKDIVDLGPYGQLFFHAMNTPCITVAEKAQPQPAGAVRVVVGRRARLPRLPEQHARRMLVVEGIRRLQSQVQKVGDVTQSEYGEAFVCPQRDLAASGGQRWHLAAPQALVVAAQMGLPLTAILDPRQGVTPGGALDIFLMSKERAQQLQLERELVFPAFKTREIRRWRVELRGRCLLYPYRIEQGRLTPAFALSPNQSRQCQNLGDALDFTIALDDHERGLLTSDLSLTERVQRVLEHRVALGIVAFPRVADYLVQNYDQLAKRVFEKKIFTQLGKRWYEYHRPRDPEFMLRKPRIACPRLLRPQHIRFALDTEGYLSDDACVFLLPRKATQKGFGELQNRLSQVLQTEASRLEVLYYVLGFLNTSYVQGVLIYGRRPTPKGSYAVNERFLSEIEIPLPTNPALTKHLIELVRTLTAGEPNAARRKKFEEEVEQVARAVLSGT